MTGSLIALGTLFLCCFLHPFVTYPVTLLLIRAKRSRAAVSSISALQDESIAVCFCAFNEREIIEAKIRNLLDLRRAHPQLEILAYVDGSTDGTEELLRRHASLIKLHVSRKQEGKTHGMNVLVEMTTASILVFTDANVLLDPDALVNLKYQFSDPAVGCVGGTLIFTNPNETETAATGMLYWKMEQRLRCLETETGSAIGADGSLFAVRRRLRPRVPDDLIEDMYVSLSVLCDGYRVVQATNVRAYERGVTEPMEDFRRRVRVSCQAFNVHRAMWPRLRRLDVLSLYKYVSHKLLRWFSVYSLAVATACFTGAAIAAGFLTPTLWLMLVASLGIYLGQRWGVGPLARFWSTLSALFGTGIGVWLSLRGERFQTWTPPPRSARTGGPVQSP